MSKPRWVIKRTFSNIRRWFGSGKDRYKGLARVHAQRLMDAIVYNLYRAPGIIIRCT
ncbi:MAG: transposase [Flavobacteriales bacterium Tduv]